MKNIPLYKFYRHKYGHELLVDVIDIDHMRRNLRQTPNLIMAFYALFIIIGEEEKIGINGQFVNAHKKIVICARPGDVWSWNKNTHLQGIGFIFDGNFLLSFFNDLHFLDHFAYLQADRNTPFMILDDDVYDRLLHLHSEMRKEIDDNRGKERDQHLLRAMLYETLMLLNRATPNKEIAAEGDVPMTVGIDRSPKAKNVAPALIRHIDVFTQLVNNHYIEHRDVDFYAARLFITSNYLNKVVRQTFGVNTKQYIQNRVMEEAKRLLKFTSLSVTEIAQRLHYETASYFVRQFSKQAGQTPSKCRSPEK